MEETIGTSGACRVFGKSRATLHRHRNPAPRAEGPRCKPSPHPAELSEDERARILAVLGSPEFADKSPGQVYTILLDRGVYLCSEASMYRLLRERGQSGDRRAQATHPAKKKPELMADGPDQVWSWDITKLKGPARGIWYLLYVIIDIYSRKVIHWEAWPTENGTLAKEFIEHAIEANEGITPQAVHADRGTSMTSNTPSPDSMPASESTSPTPARTYPTTIRTRRRTSRPSSTAPHSPANSDPSKTSTYSAATSSGTTTMNTGTPA